MSSRLSATALLLTLCVIALLAGPAWSAPAVTSSSAKEGAFCSDRTVVDYEAPFMTMRKTARPPKSGHLPFAPRLLGIALLGIDRMAIPGEKVGFWVFGGGALRPSKKLGWIVTSKLSRVDEGGRTTGIIRERRERVQRADQIDSLRTSFTVGPQPDLYRVDIAFRRGRDHLARYAEYFRVLPRLVDVRLTMNRPALEPGAELLFRIENHGTTSLPYGLPFSVEQLGLQGWTPAPELMPGGFILPELSLLGGKASACQSITVPADAEPGRYRVAKSISIPRHRKLDDHTLIAEFDVLG